MAIRQLPYALPAWLRGALGALLGIAGAGLAGALLLGPQTPALPWLVAPMGASAVLIFAVPASPLAQPWPVIGGNLVSALVGIILGHLVEEPLLAASLAVGLAIAVMGVARCLHPPGGAAALLYALGASGPDPWGAAHLLAITINVLILGVVGWLYNNATGHSWPHRAPLPPWANDRTGHSAAVHSALTQVLAEWDEIIDADVDDLDAIYRAVERRIRTAEHDAPPAAQI